MPVQCHSRSAGHPVNVWGREEGKKGREGGRSKQKEELSWKEVNNVVTSVSGEL